MNYTKGEWTHKGSIILVYGGCGGIICQMTEYRPQSGLVEAHPIQIGDPHWETQMANAYLIAAAPKMHGQLRTGVDALREAIHYIKCGEGEDALDILWGVIAGNEIVLELAEGRQR